MFSPLVDAVYMAHFMSHACRILRNHFPALLERLGGRDRALTILVPFCGKTVDILWYGIVGNAHHTLCKTRRQNVDSGARVLALHVCYLQLSRAMCA